MSDTVTIEAEVLSSRILGKDFWGSATVRAADGKTIAVIGSMLGLQPGESIRVRGVWTMHPKYGEQLKARIIEPIRASTPNGAISWLVKRLPKIGRKRAEEMIARWGVEGTWHVFDHDRERLSELGLRPDVVDQILRAYDLHRAERDRAVALRDLGLTDAQAAAAVSVYGDNAIDRIRANPYDMIAHVRGIGFRRADAIAKTCGLRHDDPARLEAGLGYELKKAAERGHTYVPVMKLISVASKLLTVGPEKVEEVARRMRGLGRLYGDMGRAQLQSLRLAERSIAGSIQRLMMAQEIAA